MFKKKSKIASFTCHHIISKDLKPINLDTAVAIKYHQKRDNYNQEVVDREMTETLQPTSPRMETQGALYRTELSQYENSPSRHTHRRQRLFNCGKSKFLFIKKNNNKYSIFILFILLHDVFPHLESRCQSSYCKT